MIADCPHVPKQAEVQKEIDATSNGYVAFALCTPTSILSGNGNGMRVEDGIGQSGLGAGEPCDFAQELQRADRELCNVQH